MKPDEPEATAAARRPPSPCIGVCQLDDAERLCVGCGRTVDEIARWLQLDEVEREKVWADLPRRLEHIAKSAQI